MHKEKRKIKQKRVLFILVMLVVSLFALNWFLTYRLESYLNKQLSKNVSEASGGFYDFSFEKLSVSLVGGELSVENITLHPNEGVFAQWQQKDTLPATYVDIKIDKIDLRGINLTWRFNYKRLNFRLFEVQGAQVKVFAETTKKDTPREEHKTRARKTLYELLAPYFDVVSANKINLLDADISYSVASDVEPAVYALQNVNFFAHQFKLDSESHARGKILYCDHFDFRVEHPQTILTNELMSLSADTIRLSTLDSIVQVKGVRMLPRWDLWEEIRTRPNEYMEASVANVELNGLNLRYEGNINFLAARNFLIQSSDIYYFDNIESDEVKEVKIDQKKDTTIQSLSLYNTISPLFASISFDNVELSKAHMRYVQQRDTTQDLFVLHRFDAYANNFRVDSLSENQKDTRQFWYSENFGFAAHNISAYMVSKNHKASLAHLVFDVKKKHLQIDSIKVHPIHKQTHKDYLIGSIASFQLNDMTLTNGIDIGELRLSDPNIEYTSFAKKGVKKTKKKTNLSGDASDVVDMFSPFLNHLYIKNINLNNANLSVNDKYGDNAYRLNNTYAYVTGFAIDHRTRYSSPYLFEFTDFGLRFSNFENYLPDKSYLLQVDRGSMQYSTGNIKLENINLIPQEKLTQEGKLSIAIHSPLLEIKGGKYSNTNIVVDDIYMQKPSVQVNLGKQTSGKKQKSTMPAVSIKDMLLDYASVTYIAHDTLHTTSDNLRLHKIEMKSASNISLAELNITNAYISKGKDMLAGKYISLADAVFSDKQIALGSLMWNDARIDIGDDATRISMQAQSLDVNTGSWIQKADGKHFLLNSFLLSNPNIEYDYTSLKTKEKSASTEKLDLYKLISPFANYVRIGKFDIINANIKYKSDKNSNKLNKTDFALEDLWVDVPKRAIDMGELAFSTEHLSLPIMDGFYRVGIDRVYFSKKRNTLQVNGVSMTSPYSKLEFAYKHPKKKDWFDIKVGKIGINGIDYSTLFHNSDLILKDLQVDDVTLLNYKNQQIEIEHNVMPLLYQELHKIPIGINIANTDVRNFEVVYEELPKKGKVAGVLFINKLNGNLKGLSNIATSPDQYMTLNADGMLMGTGYFTAKWQMPVSKERDLFKLSAHLTNFEMTELNQLIQPMAPAKIKGGWVKELTFSSEASSIGAHVKMEFLYNNLNLEIYSGEKQSKQKLYTYVANKVIKRNNPDKSDKRARVADAELERDPYHSTFNYMWQILQPPLIESVGVSKGKQNFMKRTANFFMNMKDFFTGKKHKDRKHDKAISKALEKEKESL